MWPERVSAEASSTLLCSCCSIGKPPQLGPGCCAHVLIVSERTVRRLTVVTEIQTDSGLIIENAAWDSAA